MITGVRIHDRSGPETRVYIARSEADCRDDTDRSVYRSAIELGDIITMGQVIGEPIHDLLTRAVYEAPRPCAFPHCPATAAIGKELCHDCEREARKKLRDTIFPDWPDAEPRDADTPPRQDQDRRDREERRAQ